MFCGSAEISGCSVQRLWVNLTRYAHISGWRLAEVPVEWIIDVKAGQLWIVLELFLCVGMTELQITKWGPLLLIDNVGWGLIYGFPLSLTIMFLIIELVA